MLVDIDIDTTWTTQHTAKNTRSSQAIQLGYRQVPEIDQ